MKKVREESREGKAFKRQSKLLMRGQNAESTTQSKRKECIVF